MQTDSKKAGVTSPICVHFLHFVKITVILYRSRSTE